ncbi:MAG: Gfo/Idh/MocA family oxidoreductase [Eubacteriales bacterium]|jgi:predicted dehydrogenase|nr:Gfo/Idh/MocA family oxidoreductase [Eubacteriales bacterium]
MREIGIGLVGYGAMGKAHSYAYLTMPLYYSGMAFKPYLAGVCSGHLENARQAQADLGYAFATDRFDDLLARPDVDVIDICTPNHLHREMILKAAAAGKHIYCDKPLAISGSEASEIVAAVQGKGLVHQVAFNLRFLPATMRARQLIDEGRIGRILGFRAVYLHAGSVDPQKPAGWKLDPSVSGGGVLVDMGSHILDLVRYLVGDYRKIAARSRVLYPQRPTGSGQTLEMTAEDSICLIAEMADGSIGTLEASKIATGSQDDMRFEIHGDRGALRFSLMDPNWLYYYDNTLPERSLGGERGFTQIECVQRYDSPGGRFPAPKTSLGWIRGHVHSLYSFLDCVARNRPATPSFLDGAVIQAVMDKAYEAERTGTWVDC